MPTIPTGSVVSSNARVHDATVSQQTTGPLAPQFNRETSHFKQRVKDAISEAKRLGETFHACAGAFVIHAPSPLVTFHSYGSDLPQDVKITKALPNGRLDMTIAMNVSGHDFKDQPNRDALLTARAKTNSYNIQVTYPDGRTELMSGIKANGSLHTVQDISISNVKPGEIIVEVWPDGSAGVGGYVEGRRLVIDYKPPQMNSTPV